MPLLPVLAKFLAMIVAGLVFRALASLGFAYITYTGLGSLVDTVKVHIVTMFGSVPPAVSAILGMAKIDIAINIIISAIVARLLLSGMDKVTGTITSLAMLNKAGG